jgi:two-component system, NtrC family, response regulator HupR/HoxA
MLTTTAYFLSTTTLPSDQSITILHPNAQTTRNLQRAAETMKTVLIDDEPANTQLLERILENYETVSFSDPVEAYEYCRNNYFDLLIADQKMPRMTGIELVHKIRQRRNNFMALIISAYTDAEDLIDAVNSNLIYKYIVKPYDPGFLLQQVYRASEHLTLTRRQKELEEELRLKNRRLQDENALLKSEYESPLDNFIGFSPEILHIKESVGMIARSEQPVLLLGETGTGKELLARAIHDLSNRHDKPFYAVNCSAIPESLIESELFGYKKGAFTGAVAGKRGIFTLTDGGTLFLDEIGEIPTMFQAKLLRILQFGTFFPVGSEREETADVRIISAANIDITAAVDSSSFRQDLYYRINTFELDIPPLRERSEDIIAIFEHLRTKKQITLPPFSDDALQKMTSYPFPGNVRELENVLEKLNILTRVRNASVIDTDVLSESLGKQKPPQKTDHPNDEIKQEPISLQEQVEEVERSIISTCLRNTNGNISETARLLSLSRQGLKNKMRRYGLRPHTEEKP